MGFGTMKTLISLFFVLTASTCFAFDESSIVRPRFCVLVTDSDHPRNRNCFRGFLLKSGSKMYLLHGAESEHKKGGKLICENRNGIVLEFPIDLVVNENSKKSLPHLTLVAYELTEVPVVHEHFSFAILGDEQNSFEKCVACAILESESLYSDGLPFVSVPVQTWARAEVNSHFGFGESCHIVQPMGLPMYSPTVENRNGQFVLAGLLQTVLQSSERTVAGQVVISPFTVKRLIAGSNETR